MTYLEVILGWEDMPSDQERLLQEEGIILDEEGNDSEEESIVLNEAVKEAVCLWLKRRFGGKFTLHQVRKPPFVYPDVIDDELAGCISAS